MRKKQSQYETRQEGEERGRHSHHLQQGQVASAHVVKVDFDILPPDLGIVLLNQGLALGPVVDIFHGKVFL